MKLVLEKKHENRIEFLVDGTTSGFANMLRRYAMSRVPVMAIDSVTFYDNSSAFWDEYIGHRLGLMPVATPAKTSEKAEVILSVDAAGPTVVKSGDFKSSDKEIKMAREDIVVVTLDENQTLRLEGKAVLNNSRRHAKFQAGLLGYGETDEDGKFKVFVESFYQMSPAEVLLRGCGIVEDDVDELLEAVGKKPAKKKAVKKTAAKKTVKKTAKKPSKKKEE